MPGGRGGRGGRAGNVGRGGQKGEAPDRVCKPHYKESQNIKHLLPQVQENGVPSKIQEVLTDFSGFQTYFTALEKLEPEIGTKTDYSSCWLGIPEDEIKTFEREEDNRFYGTLTTRNGKQEPVFIKRIHLLDPILTVEGGCVWPREGALPAPKELWLNTLDKVNEPLNEAYVDAVFAAIADRMVRSGISPHWLRSFGTFPARVEKYMYNVSEEYSSLRRKTFWNRNQQAGIFSHIVQDDEDDDDNEYEKGPRVQFSEGEDLAATGLDIEELDNLGTNNESVEEITAEDANSEITVDSVDAEIKLAPPKLRLKKLSNSTHSSDVFSYSSHESDYCDHYVEFKDFPVQVTLLERAEGTMDELLEEEDVDITEERENVWKAWIFQVIAGLSIAQYWFGFVHNDLHTNNIMWTKTDKEYLYYRVHKGNTNWILRVPTFGYIMKIIDFGRASYHLPGPAGFFISDAFFPGNDAAEQYNCEPFYDSEDGKKVEPNPSFDLSRLSVSMIEALYPVRPANATPIKIVNRDGKKIYAETVSPLYNLLWEWLIDDEGKSILRTPDGEERYPAFDLYSAIAADVHKAVPSQQVDKPLFAEYKFTGKTEGAVYDLWIR